MSAEPDGRGRADIRVLIADDQKVVREGLVSLIGLLPGITVVGAATDGDDAVRQALELEPDVVLMDLNMPRCNGVEATERLRRLRPDILVVVLTTYSDDTWVFSALQAGARGFLTKDAGRGRDTARDHRRGGRPRATRPVRTATAPRRVQRRRPVRRRPPPGHPRRPGGARRPGRAARGADAA